MSWGHAGMFQRHAMVGIGVSAPTTAPLRLFVTRKQAECHKEQETTKRRTRTINVSPPTQAKNAARATKRQSPNQAAVHASNQDTEPLPCVLSFEFILQCRLALWFQSY